MEVMIRTRPTVNFASKNIIIDEKTGDIFIYRPKDQSQGFVNHTLKNWKFNFNKVLCNVLQEEVYDCCAKQLVNNVLEGYSGTIISFG